MVQKKRAGSAMLQKVTDHLNRSVMMILIVNNIVNIVGSILVGHTVTNLFGSAALGITTTGLTFGIIIFSEIIPKSLGTHYAKRIGLMTAPFIVILTTILSPIIIPIEALTKLMQKGERKVGTEAQIRSLVRIGRREGHIEADEGHLIYRAFRLNDATAGSIMAPLEDVIAFPIEMKVEEAMKEIMEHPHTRYPVYEGDIDSIVGVIMQRDISIALFNKQGNEPIEKHMREVLQVEDEMPADDLLILFRDEHSHLAVVKEGGTTVGLVTLEDVLEELVGEIEDEQDQEERLEEEYGN